MHSLSRAAAVAALFLVPAGLTLAQATQPAQPRPPFPGVNVPLFQMQDVRRDVNITDQQLGRLNQSLETVQGRFRNDFAGLEKLNERERAARSQELARNFNTELMKASGDVLSAEQMNRLRQLELQRQGIQVFSDPDVQKRLNLTDQQRTQLRDLGDTTDKGIREIRGNRELKREDAIKRFDTLDQQTRERINTILTEQQRKTWAEMIGKPFTFRPDFDGR